MELYVKLYPIEELVELVVELEVKLHAIEEVVELMVVRVEVVL